MADSAGTEFGFKYFVFKTDGFGYPGFYVAAEGYFLLGKHARKSLLVNQKRQVEIDLPQFSTGPDDDAAVGGIALNRKPVKTGINAENRPGFLLVFVEAVVDRKLFARAEVAHEERGFGVHPAHEGQPFAVGTYLRTAGSAGTAGYFLDFAFLPVVSADGKNLFKRVFVVLEKAAAVQVFAEIHITPVGTYAGFVHILLVVFALGELNTVAAGKVVKPHFAGAERAGAGEMFAGHEILAVGHPGGVVQQAKRFGGHLPGLGAVGVHHPDIVAAACIAREKQLFAVGRKARLHFPSQAGADTGGVAAGDGHGVNVTQQVKSDCFAVGTDVKVHPRSFRDAEGGVGVGDTFGSRYVPLFFVGLGEKGGRCREETDCSQNSFLHDVKSVLDKSFWVRVCGLPWPMLKKQTPARSG